MAKRNMQLAFTNTMAKTRKEHGGDITRGKRKVRRPLDRNKGLHVVMRSVKAKRAMSLCASPQRASDIYAIVKNKAKIYGVKIEQYANVGNHIHLLIRFADRKMFQNFLRVVTGLIARRVTKAEKTKAFGKFWDQLTYTRIVERGKDFALTRRYVELNEMEGAAGGMARAYYEDRWKFKPWWWRAKMLEE